MEGKPEITSVEWTHRHYVRDDEYIPYGEDIEAFLKREIAKPIIRWEDSPQLGYEILPNKYFYRYQPPTPAKELLAEFWRLGEGGREDAGGIGKRMNPLHPDWTYDRLKDVSAINAASLPADTNPNYEFDYLEISNVDYHGIVDPVAIERLRYEDAPSRARRRITKNCTVISSVRPNLQAVAFIDNGRKNFVCSTGFNVVQPAGQRLSPKFVYYTLISENARQYFEATAKGVGYPAIDDKDFGSFLIPLPPLPEQQRIAAYLDASCMAIDAAVAAKRHQIETLDSLRKSIIQQVVTTWPRQMPDTSKTGSVWIEEIPEKWQLVALKRLCEIQTGLTLGKSYEGALIERPYLRVANVQDGHVDLSDITTIEVPASVARRVELRSEDVLMTEGGDLDKLGRGTIWMGRSQDACIKTTSSRSVVFA